MTRLLLVLLLACNSSTKSDDRQRKLDDATQAMTQYRAASQDIAATFPEMLTKLESKLIFDPASAAKQLGEQILPKLDGYVAALERAVTTSELYLATGTDVGSDVIANVDALRRRLAALRTAREQLGKLQTELATHPGLADLERIAKELAAAGTALVTAP